MYKGVKIITFFSTLGWLAFIFAAFNGYTEWYTGFSFFFWLSLGILNYRHRTSLWLLKNKLRDFLFFYGQLIVLSFFLDLIIGQKLTGFWSYPAYDSTSDW